MTDLCRTCAVLVPLALSWQRGRDGGYQVRAGCPRCGNWLRWQTQTPEVLALVGPMPAGPKEDRPVQGKLF